MANIANLKQALGAGGRVNKYRINFSIPSTVPVSSELQNADVLCKAAQFPGVTITPIEVFNQGRKLVIPGDTVYENTWSLTFYNTADHGLRRDLLSWMRSADDFQKNTHSGNPNDILGELSVTQLDSLGKDTVTYTFHNVWVSGVDAVEVTDDADGGIQEFAVTFSFSDWVVGGGELSEPTTANKASDNSIA
jgi:hypothetical protein